MPADTNEVDWTTFGFVRASDYRTRVLHALDDGPATPTELGERAGLEITHVSRTLSELQDHDLAELLVPEDTHKGRIYGLTDDGETIATEVEG